MKNLTQKGSSFKDLEINWSKSPISDIIIGDSNCPEGYEHLLNNQWPGTVAGCKCYFKVDRGACSRKKKKSIFCHDIRPTIPLPLNNWEGKLLCAKRLGRSYFENVKSKEYCKNGMRSCGVIDSLNNNLCVDSTQNCPINKIVFAEKNSIPTDYNYTTLTLGTNKKLYFTTEATDNPIYVDIKVSEGDVCIDAGQKNSINGDPYILVADYHHYYCTNSLDGEFHDERYTLLDSISKIKYYNDNNMTSYLLSLIDYPLINLNGNVNLYSRDYVGWNENKCDHSKINDSSVHLTHRKYIEDWFYSFYVIIFCSFLILLISVNSDPNDKKKIKYNIWIDIVLLCFLVPTLFLSFYETQNFYIMYEKFESLVGITCGDHIVNSLLRETFNNINKNFVYNFCFILFQVLIIMCATSHILYKVYWEKKDESYKEIKPVDNEEIIKSENLIGKNDQ